MGQYIRLAADLQAGRIVEQPDVTRARYVTHPVGMARLSVRVPAADLTGNTKSTLKIVGTATPGARVAIPVTGAAGGASYTPSVAANGAFTVTVNLPSAYVVKNSTATQDRAGNSALVVRRVNQ